jgi:hypothetical protein
MLKALETPEAKARFAEQARREGRSVAAVEAETRASFEGTSSHELLTMRDIHVGVQQEYASWKHLRVLCPPPHADDVPALQSTFALMRLRLSPNRRVQQAQLRDIGPVPPADEARRLLKAHWRPNVTMYNPTRFVARVLL